MPNQGKNIMIGAFILLALVTVIWIFSFLNPNVGDSAKVIRVRFTDLEKINIGTRVALAGRPIGEVVSIHQVEDARNLPTDSFGNLYYYEVRIAIDSRTNIYDTDEVGVHTSGLLGEKAILITPRPPRNGRASEPLDESAVIYSQSVGSVSETLGSLSAIAAKAETTFDGLNKMINSNQDEIAKTLQSLTQAVEEIDRSLKRANTLDIVGHITDGARDFSTTMRSMNDSLLVLRENKALENLSNTFSNIEEITRSFNQSEEIKTILNSTKQFMSQLNKIEPNLLAATESAKLTMDTLREASTKFTNKNSSLGRFLSDEEMYLRTVTLFNKADVLMNDINHYGLLFHLDKSWQRQRSKRRRRIESIDSAREFKNYYETEMSEITSSLSRIAMVLEEFEEQGKRSESEDKALRKAMGELLRQVGGMEDSLKFYTEVLLESAEENAS